MKLADPTELLQRTDAHVGTSEWHTISQSQIDLFADATGDHQWIHTDPVRASDGPFGTTVAHGYLTLSLLPKILFEVLEVGERIAVVNYGLNRVRFPSPVPADSHIRASVALKEVREKKPGTVEATLAVEFERQGATVPPCVAEAVMLFAPA